MASSRQLSMYLTDCLTCPETLPSTQDSRTTDPGYVVMEDSVASLFLCRTYYELQIKKSTDPGCAASCKILFPVILYDLHQYELQIQDPLTQDVPAMTKQGSKYLGYMAGHEARTQGCIRVNSHFHTPLPPGRGDILN